jgi:hypothetical protein
MIKAWGSWVPVSPAAAPRQTLDRKQLTLSRSDIFGTVFFGPKALALVSNIMDLGYISKIASEAHWLCGFIGVL